MNFLTISQRRSIADQTIKETASIIASQAHKGATQSSTFFEKVPPLVAAASPGFETPRRSRVVVLDTFAAARAMIVEGAQPQKTAVLNLASDIRPGGGWIYSLSETQEEALCYSSTLYATLRPEWFPWDNRSAAGIWSPGIVVHRDTLTRGCELLPETEWVVVGVITVAAPRFPAVDGNGNLRNPVMVEVFREKVRAVLRMAAAGGRENVVLGAMGCGVYGCPPGHVARIMAEVLQEPEWKGWFERVWWAVVDPLREGNAGVFAKVCESIPLP